MSSIPIFVGLDYHQDAVQICSLNREGERLCDRSVPNDIQVIERVVALSNIREHYTFDISCQGSVPKSIIAFLESDSYDDAVRNAMIVRAGNPFVISE